jgi:hypothetical protein
MCMCNLNGVASERKGECVIDGSGDTRKLIVLTWVSPLLGVLAAQVTSLSHI